MKFVKSPKFLIFLIVFVNFLGYGIVFPVLPLMTEKYGGDPLISGLLIGVFSLMQLVATPVLGKLSDRFGRRPLLLYSLWGTVASFAIMGWTHSIFWLMVARVIDGISGGNVSIAQAYMADVSDKKERAGAMGVLTAGISSGFILGPIWGGLFSGISLSAPFLAAAGITLVSVLLTQFFLPESESVKEMEYEKKYFSFKSLILDMENRPMLVFFFIYMFIFWAQSGVFTTMSLFGKDILNISVEQVSFIFALGGIVSTFIQGFGVSRLVKKFEEKKLLIISIVAATAGFAVMSFAGSMILFIIGVTVYNIGGSLIVPVVNALVSEKSPAHDQGGNLGLLQSFGSMGRLFGPVAAGFVYEKVNPFFPAIMGTFVMITMLFLSWQSLSTDKLKTG
ncbi:MFS transporter [Patescibacteria group bacterium]|nr:MFS transporter [Patescibacteria group bacterium]MCL5797578.1 MFS transporter [Patescibacteria group bacterium]